MKIYLLIALLSVTLFSKSLFSNKDQQYTSEYIGTLKNLLISTQKVRGLTNSYRNGNEVARLLIRGNVSNMRKSMKEILLNPLSKDAQIKQTSHNITQSLNQINKDSLKLDPALIFKKYTQEVQEIIVFAKILNAKNTKDLNPIGKDLSKIMINDILPLSESIGQLRGLGAGLASKKSATPKEHQHLQELVKSVKKLHKNLQNTLQTALNKHASKIDPSINAELKKLYKNTIAYIHKVEKNFYTNPINVDSDEYFDEGTEIITNAIKTYDICNKAILKDSDGWL